MPVGQTQSCGEDDVGVDGLALMYSRIAIEDSGSRDCVELRERSR